MKPMRYVARPMGLRKRIALIAHDNTKHDLLEWARFNKGLLAEHELYATGTTGRLILGDKGSCSNPWRGSRTGLHPSRTTLPRPTPRTRSVRCAVPISQSH